MSLIVGALGSVIGYLGAEAASESFFERLLWPERFYNDAHPYTLLKLALCLPMAGPLHGAALEALDTFRDNGLYLGQRRGDMLGTTFYHNTGVTYHHLRCPAPDQRGPAKDARNGFWVQVLREVKGRNRSTRLPQPDLVDPGTNPLPPYRAMQLVHHLKLHYAKKMNAAAPDVVGLSESGLTKWTTLLVIASELSSIAVAITAALAKPFKTYWVAGYLLVPLFLKLVSLLVSVRRDAIRNDEDETEGLPESQDELYEIQDPRHGFAIVQAPSSVFLQFCRHYGHPKRDTGVSGRGDRRRELISMGLVYLFVLYFPAGLIGSLWMPGNTQLLWLSFQVYTIVMMHIVRIVGWENCARTEARVARHLEAGQRVWLRGPNGLGILAHLETVDVPNVDSTPRVIAGIVETHFQNRSQRRT